MMQTAVYSRTQIDKIGNAAIYFATELPNLSKTKLLKLLFFLEEVSIKKCGFPFFNIRFDVWKHGPVAKDIYIDLSDTPELLAGYIKLKNKTSGDILPEKAFDDGEFSENDIQIMEYVCNRFRRNSASELVDLTHHKHSVWYKTAQKHSLLVPFELGFTNSSDTEVDFALIFSDEQQRAFYLENKKMLAFSQQLKD